MSPDDELDRFVRAAVPPAAPHPARVSALIAATLARVPRRWSPLDRVRAFWPDWVERYAIPMATAAMLGLLVGRQMAPIADAADQISMFLSPSIVLAGF
jgi:hypothetical protein